MKVREKCVIQNNKERIIWKRIVCEIMILCAFVNNAWTSGIKPTLKQSAKQGVSHVLASSPQMVVDGLQPPRTGVP